MVTLPLILAAVLVPEWASWLKQKEDTQAASSYTLTELPPDVTPDIQPVPDTPSSDLPAIAEPQPEIDVPDPIPATTTRPKFDAARIAAMDAATELLLEDEEATSWMLERGYDLFDTQQSFEQYTDEELQRLADNDDLLATQELGWRAAGRQDLNQAKRWHLTAAARGSTQAIAYLASHEYTVSFNMQEELRPEQLRKTQAWFLVMAERGDPFATRLPNYLATLPWPVPEAERNEVEKLAEQYRYQLQQIREQEGRGEFDDSPPPPPVESLAQTLDA